MLTIEPTGAVLGATVWGVDVSKDLDERTFGQILRGLGEYGVLRFPGQRLDMNELRRFRNDSARSRGRAQARLTQRRRTMPRWVSCQTSRRTAHISGCRTPGRIGTPTCRIAT